MEMPLDGDKYNSLLIFTVTGLKYYNVGHFTTYFSQVCITFGVASLLFIYRMVHNVGLLSVTVPATNNI